MQSAARTAPVPDRSATCARRTSSVSPAAGGSRTTASWSTASVIAAAMGGDQMAALVELRAVADSHHAQLVSRHETHAHALAAVLGRQRARDRRRRGAKRPCRDSGDQVERRARAMRSAASLRPADCPEQRREPRQSDLQHLKSGQSRIRSCERQCGCRPRRPGHVGGSSDRRSLALPSDAAHHRAAREGAIWAAASRSS